MKAISLYQPWASAVALGLKGYDTRNWSTSYRGELAIHAAKRWTPIERAFWCSAFRGLQACQSHGLHGITAEQVREFQQPPPLGCIIAVVNLTECWSTDGHQHGHDAGFGPDWVDRLSDLERLFGDFAPGRYAWQLADVIRFPEPIPCAGMQGLWTPPGKFIDEIDGILDCMRSPQT